jgi:hypothetical protein
MPDSPSEAVDTSKSLAFKILAINFIIAGLSSITNILVIDPIF